MLPICNESGSGAAASSRAPIDPAAKSLPLSRPSLTSRPFSELSRTCRDPTLLALSAAAVPPRATNSAMHETTFANVSRSLIAHQA